MVHVAYLIPHIAYLIPHVAYLIPHIAYLIPQVAYLIPYAYVKHAVILVYIEYNLNTTVYVKSLYNYVCNGLR